MLATSPYPHKRYPIGILDLSPVLLSSSPLAPEMAVSKLPPLAYLLVAARLGELYEIIFPEHPEWLDEIVAWKNEEAVAKAVERFLSHVAALFPIQDECWEMEMEIIEWRLYSIPVIPQGFDIWHDGWDEVYEPAPYLLHMLWQRDEADDLENPNEFRQQYPEHLVPRGLEPQRLIDTLRSMALPEPFHALPDLIEMLIQGTGNVWLDIGEISLMEGGGYPEWDPAEVAFLAEEWQAAEPIYDRVHALLDWHNETPASVERKVTAVHQILLEAYQHQEPGFMPQLKMIFAEETSDERPHPPTFATTTAFAP